MQAARLQEARAGGPPAPRPRPTSNALYFFNSSATVFGPLLTVTVSGDVSGLV